MPKKITTIGGQALMEGIMMVGPKRTTAAFCDEQGSISTEDISIERITKKYPILGKPFIRGIFSMVDTFRLGYKALSLSAEKLTGGQEEELTGLDKWLDDHLGEKMTGIVMAIGSVLGIGLAIVLFFMLPTFLFNLVQSVVGGDISGWRSVFEGALRIFIFLGYVLLVSLMPDIKRVFQYHGAEHKTIFCYEADLPLTVENVRAQGRFHPRCGTSFIVLVLIISILVSSFISWQSPLLRMVLKLLTLPVVIGIAYELIKLAGRYTNPLTRLISAPGLCLQRLTTAEPDDGMIEIAIAAMKPVIPEDANADNW